MSALFASLAFTSPWLLLGLLVLPLLWFLLRATPPAPKKIAFPAIDLVRGLQPKEVTASKTPWWLLLLRLLALACLIIGLAGPLLSPEKNTSKNALLLLIDDGWAAAANWSARQTRIASVLSQAQRNNRTVYFATGSDAQVTGPVSAGEAARTLKTLEPKPWKIDRPVTLSALDQADLPKNLDLVWLSNGVSQSINEVETLKAISGLGNLTLFADETPSLKLLPPERKDRMLDIIVERSAVSDQAQPLTLVATDVDGKLVTEEELFIEAGAKSHTHTFDLPREVRNRLYRIEIDGQASAGAVQLLDTRWQQRSIGIISSVLKDKADANRLLSEQFYLNTALEAFAEVESSTVDDLLAKSRSVLFWPDASDISFAEENTLLNWIETGGTLVRFSGPNLANETLEQGGENALLPVRLRVGDRSIGGALNWTRPARLLPFVDGSIFAELDIPDDVRIKRQLLAEPSLDLADKSWATLEDGTPLVTAEQRGDGQIVLIHTGATPRWSNLPISGLFVEMLQKIVLEAKTTESTQAATSLQPISLLDGFGKSRGPLGTDKQAKPESFTEQLVSADNPPGLYGTESERRALNLSRSEDRFVTLKDVVPNLKTEPYGDSQERSLMHWLLIAAFILLLLDLIARLVMNGAFRRSGVIAACLAVVFLQMPEVSAQTDKASASILETRLAYIRTGERRTDATSRAGLSGLTKFILRRTSIELADPVGLDLSQDELIFHPLIYWPIKPEQEKLPTEQVTKINAYLAAGGMLIIDTQDASTVKRARGNRALMTALRGISIPPLQPIGEGHVMTKSFYLLDWFPGRWANGEVWVATNASGDEEAGLVNDGVSPVIIGGADWAAAWALDGEGKPMFPVVPGMDRQRIMAFRFGVNAVMYALAGNYKADQVHIGTILQRLGARQ